MKIGVSTACFYPEKTEVALSHILQNGVHENGAEVVEFFLNTYSETKISFAKELKNQIDAKGIAVSSVHPFTSKHEQHLFFSDYERRFEDGLEHYNMYYEFANYMGAKLVVLHGCMTRAEIENHDYFERFAKMREHAKSHGIILAQENVAPYKSHSIEFIRQMKEYLHGEVEFVFDLKQTVRAKQDPYAMLNTMGKNTVHIHISDNKTSHKPYGDSVCLDCLPIGVGDFNFFEFFSQLNKIGFDKTMVLELYRHNYKEYNELYKSVAKLKQIKSRVDSHRQ